MPPSSEPVRILIVDSHKIVREGLRMLIENQPQMLVVGSAGNGDEALALARRERPNIILLELDLGGSSGLELLPELLSAAKGAKVLVLTGVRHPGQHRRAVMLGAMGLVLKEEASEVLFKAIEKVSAGEDWLDHRTAAYALSHLSKPPPSDSVEGKIAGLTPREREIIALICQGLKNKEVGERMFISEGTVRNHLTTILSKLELSDRFELALFSFCHGLAKPPHRQ